MQVCSIIIVIVSDSFKDVCSHCSLVRSQAGFRALERVPRSRMARSADELLSPLHVRDGAGRVGFKMPGGVSICGVVFRLAGGDSECC